MNMEGYLCFVCVAFVGLGDCTVWLHVPVDKISSASTRGVSLTGLRGMCWHHVRKLKAGHIGYEVSHLNK